MRKRRAEGSRPGRGALIISGTSVALLLGWLFLFRGCEKDLAPSADASGGGGAPASSLNKTTVPKPEPIHGLTASPAGTNLPSPGKRDAGPTDKAVKKAAQRAAPDDSMYVWAEPWGGRHFDSVEVAVFCRENCLAVYSLADSVNFRSFERPLHLLRDQTVWIAGLNLRGEYSRPVRLDYVIERARGNCPPDMASFGAAGRETCIDIYEWPNRPDSLPRAMVTQREAAALCAGAGRRLCAAAEWTSACGGPEQSLYPYEASFDPRHCPVAGAEEARAGRFPACRSYYGLYDLTGNLWEWTATPAPEREGAFLAAGGGWNSGDQASCREMKFSFYAQNRYPMVGFRCCADAGMKP